LDGESSQHRGLRVGTRTIQTHLRGSRAPRPRGQARATFPRNHAGAIWACDFLPVTALCWMSTKTAGGDN
jgi:hypothetical protein